MVHTGLIDLMKSDDEIAAVLGHEAAHVLARHVVFINAAHTKLLDVQSFKDGIADLSLFVHLEH